MLRGFSQRATTVLCAVALALTSAGSCVASTINVPVDQPTIQAGINAAINGDTVLAAPGTYNEAINFNGKAITLRSTGGADVTTINATGLGASAVMIPTTNGAGTPVIRGFTITGGTGTLNGSARRGGGVNVTGGSLSLVDCKITGNTAIGSGGFGAAGSGGGVAFTGDTLTMVNCEVAQNSVGGCSSIGAGVVAGGNSVTLIDCIIRNNGGSGGCAGLGGGSGSGLYLGGVANATLVNCEIFSNTASGSGGGAQGAGIYNASSNTTLINCRVTNNVTSNIFASTTFASGFYNSNSSTATLHNCTISNNTRNPASPMGAGGVFTESGPVHMDNCIVTGNTGTQLSANSVVQFSCVQDGFAGPGNINATPLFVNEASGDFRLQDGSPCRDTGDRTLLPADAQDLDADGNTTESLSRDFDFLRRIVNGQVDMGAFEWQHTCVTDIVPSSPGSAGNGTTDIDDLLTVINNWGTCDQCIADINGDDSVNIDDLLLAINGWGACKG